MMDDNTINNDSEIIWIEKKETEMLESGKVYGEDERHIQEQIEEHGGRNHSSFLPHSSLFHHQMITHPTPHSGSLFNLHHLEPSTSSYHPVASSSSSSSSLLSSALSSPKSSMSSFASIAINGSSSTLFSDPQLINLSLSGGSSNHDGGNLIQDVIDQVNDSFVISRKNASDILNVSQDVSLEWAIIMFGYIMPLLFIITLIANSLIVIVLAQRHMRTPTNMVLLSMAISDLLTMTFPAPWYFYVYTLGHHSKLLHPVIACYLFHCMTEVLPGLFHTASIWLTLLLAIQRYIYVCHPIMARTWCTVPRVMKLIIWLYLISLLHQGTRFADRSFTSVMVVDEDGSSELGCRFSTSQWVYFFDITSYYLTYYGFRILFVHTFPITALVILNLLLFRALKRAQVTRDRLFQQNPNKSESSRMRDSTNTTIMLIVVVTVFLATETPLATCTVLHVIQNVIGQELVSYTILNQVISVTNFAIMCSYPVNFGIYCGMSLQFRETFKDLFIRGVGSGGVRASPGGERSTMRRPTEVQLLTLSRLSIPNGQRTVTETNL